MKHIPFWREDERLSCPFFCPFVHACIPHEDLAWRKSTVITINATCGQRIRECWQCHHYDKPPCAEMRHPDNGMCMCKHSDTWCEQQLEPGNVAVPRPRPLPQLPPGNVIGPRKKSAMLACDAWAPNKVRYRCDFPQAIRNAPMAEKGAFGRKKQNRHNARTKLECSSVLALPCCQSSLNHQFYGSKTLSNVFSLSNSEGNRPSVSTKRMPRSFRLCTFSGVGQW